MNNELESRRRKSYVQLRMAYDLTMGVLILGIGLILFFGNRFGLPLIEDLDTVIRFGFGSLCLLYGSFRVYRAVKRDY